MNPLSLLAAMISGSLWTWIRHLGGPGLILLGILDNSAIPVPGSMDVAVVLLCAHRKEWWAYYGLMATLGAVLGGFITYRLAEKGGEETLEKKVGKERSSKVYRRFREHGFVTVVLGGILPPPFPVVPVLAVAGVLHYPPKKFLAAIGTGRAIRFFAVAYLASLYGHVILTWFAHSYKPVLYALIALALAAGLWALVYFGRLRRQKNSVARDQA